MIYGSSKRGYNVYRMDVDEDAALNRIYQIDVEGEVAGSQGSPAHFDVRVVTYNGETRSYDTMPMTDGISGTLDVPVLRGDALYLIVAATPNKMTGMQTYAYRYRIRATAGFVYLPLIVQ